jgi:hypothetical protein
MLEIIQKPWPWYIAGPLIGLIIPILLIIGNKLLPLFILTTILLFGLMLTPYNNQAIKHLLWVGFIILMSIVGYPIYMLAKEEKIFYKVLITLAILFIGMSYIAYSNKFISLFLLFGSI